MSHELDHEAGHVQSALQTIRPRLKFKRRRLAASLGYSTGRSQRRLCSSGYLRLYNRHVQEFNAEADILDALPGRKHRSPVLQASHILGTLWTAAEKEQFFKSLSRRGKSQAEAIAREVKTKSVVEILAYLHLLRSNYIAIRQHQSQVPVSRRHEFGLLTYADLPVAAEMSATLLAIEMRESDKLQSYINQRRHNEESQTLGWSVVDAAATWQVQQVLDTTATAMSSTGETNPSLVSQLTPDLELFDTTEMLNLLRALSIVQSGGTSQTTGLYRSTLRALHDRITALTRSLVGAAIRLSETRHAAEAAGYFHRAGTFTARGLVSRLDVVAAAQSVSPACLEKRDTAGQRNKAKKADDASDDDDDESHSEDEPHHEDRVIDRLDARNDAVMENEYRRVMGISISLPLPATCTAREVASAARYAAQEEYDADVGR